MFLFTSVLRTIELSTLLWLDESSERFRAGPLPPAGRYRGENVRERERRFVSIEFHVGDPARKFHFSPDDEEWRHWWCWCWWFVEFPNRSIPS
jgi:hypothetical protein